MSKFSILVIVYTPEVRQKLGQLLGESTTNLHLEWLPSSALDPWNISHARPYDAILLETGVLPASLQKELLQNEPAIALTPDESTGVAVVEQGACDFLTLAELSPISLHHCVLHVAARKSDRSDLYAERKRYYDLFNNVNDLIYMRAPDGRVTEWNQAGERLTGYSRQDMMGRDLLDIVAPEDRELARRMHASKLAGEPATRYHIAVIRKDGARIELEINSRPILSQQSILGVSGIARDVTEHRRTELALQRSEELFRRLFETAPIGMALIGNDRKFLRGNPALCGMFGYNESELRQIEPGQLAHPDDAPAGAEPRAQFHLTGEYGPVRRRYVHRDGHVLWVHARATRVLDDQGQPLYNLAILQDVTEQAETDAALRASEQRYRSLIASASIGIALSDHAGDLIQANHAFARIFALPEAELAGKNWRDLYPPEQHAELRRRHEAILRREAASLHFEQNFLTPGGAEIWTRHTSTLILNDEGEPLYVDASGQPLYVLDMIEDITARRQLELRLRRSERLETIGRLAGGLAHDFNNLLTVMNGAGRILWAQAAGQPALRDPLEQLLKAGERASTLSAQLLTIGKSETVERKLLDLHRLLPEFSAEWRKLAGGNASLNLKLSPEPLWILAHRGQLERLLSNLISNAADALPVQGGSIDVEVRPRHWNQPQATVNLTLPPGDYVEICVSDTGKGIDESTRAHLFEPFFTSKDYPRGSGLGLAIVHGIAEQNQAGLVVESMPGNGTRILVYWPQTPAPAEAPRPPRLLVVDDEEGVRWFTRSVLELAGFDVLEAAGGGAAERWYGAASDPIDLLITDVIMPEMTGVELAAKLRAHRPGLPVLYISAYAPHNLQLSEPIQGADPAAQILAKPFTPEQLLERVHRQLARPELNPQKTRPS